MNLSHADRAEVLRLLRDIRPLVEPLLDHGPWAIGWKPDEPVSQHVPPDAVSRLEAFRNALADIQ